MNVLVNGLSTCHVPRQRPTDSPSSRNSVRLQARDVSVLQKLDYLIMKYCIEQFNGWLGTVNRRPKVSDNDEWLPRSSCQTLGRAKHELLPHHVTWLLAACQCHLLFRINIQYILYNEFIM